MEMICLLFVIISCVLAQEQSVTINKPKPRLPKTWGEANTDVRCFCNLPHCVFTGYMCKSNNGGCFSDLDASSKVANIYRGRHGCIDYLNESQLERCASFIAGKEDAETQKSEDPKRPKRILVCCSTDMCNHIDNPLTRNLLNKTLDAEDKIQHRHQEIYLYSNSEVWFRAATIAVPICGAVILFVLIALAMKFLKREKRNSLHNKLGPVMYAVPAKQGKKWSSTPYKPCTVKRPYYPQSHPHAFRLGALGMEQEPLNRPQFQMPLVITTSETGPRVSSVTGTVSAGVSKNDTNAKSNSTRSIILDLEKNTTDHSQGVNLNSEDKFCKDGEKTFIS